MLESQLEKWIISQANQPLPVALVLPSGQRVELGTPIKVVMRLRDFSAIRALMNPTLSNLGSAYVEGQLDIDGRIEDIVEVAVGLSKFTGGDDFTESSMSLLQRLLAHSRKRDRGAIEYHYDVSNDFYRLFLDRNLVYSCGYFRNPDDSLDIAQLQKLDHILTKLQVKPGDRLLDVGCGWGALIIRAAQRGAHAVGVTLSRNQYDLARERIAELGLSGLCEVRLQDYRDIPASEQFNKIASVGMFEHVGLKNLKGYFEKMHSLLSHGGAMLMHGITATHPELREVGRGGGEFIDKYVFPDGELPHLSFAIRTMAETGFEVVDSESLRRHYHKTLTHWANRLEEHAEQARSAAGERRFRIWRVYLAGCAYGFLNNWMNIYQMLACRLGGPEANPFPMTRDWMYASAENRAKETASPPPDEITA
ncbi:MAG: class I SAM-dependent methyltransferase [Burkholderiaceae bacterium]|jgi:cyclopropane-fatty-acyl-phospholipid synthase